MGLIANLFNKDKQIYEVIKKEAQEIEALANKYSELSDEELKNKTKEFKEKLQNGASLNSIKIDAYATVRETAKRVLNEYPFTCQLQGALVLNNGDIAELNTGEGKTLTSTMPIYLNALTGKGVHVVTVNEYLAKRDSEWMGKIFSFLGLSVGLNVQGLFPEQKKEAYNCDITYTTDSELGFDYLRDNMVTNINDRVLRGLNFALIDEVDSILIDDARTPLIISGEAKTTASLYIDADRFVKGLKKEDYEIDLKLKNASLTRQGIDKAEKYYKLDNLFKIENSEIVHFITEALRANYVMHKDVDYTVEEGVVYIIDPNTGRKMVGREWSDGLHQAVQAKERVDIKKETQTIATITYQNFFRLYDKLAGMTGTAKTEQEEFLEIYNMRVIKIPTNKPVIRQDMEDLIFSTKNAKWNALVDKIKELHSKGQPVLVGTIAVETSELLSKRLKKAGIPHEVLNAKNHAREAEIIAKAGQKGSVTIATNMAGRGTDIKLGNGIKELGGLAVLGSERHESRRIDNQLRGRSGRQGDPGYSRFFISLEDDLMLRFGNETLRNAFKNLGDAPIENKSVSKAISAAQARVEGSNYDMRKTVLDYDNVMSKQRDVIYKERDRILNLENLDSVIEDMFSRTINKIVDSSLNEKNKLDWEKLSINMKNLGMNISVEDFKNNSIENIKKEITKFSFENYKNKIEPFKNTYSPVEKTIVLRMFDRAWMKQIDDMTKLKDGIGFRGYGQINPLQAYKEEAYIYFQNMFDDIATNVVAFVNNLQFEVNKKSD